MNKNYQQALTAVLKHEGGYVNHPKDPGGATNFGVTQAVYDAYRRSYNRKTQSVRYIAPGEVEVIYRTRYWDAVHGDQLPSGLDFAVFDFAVNSGPKRAVEYLQRILKVTDDGQMGPVTVAAIRSRDSVDLIHKLMDARLAFLKRLAHWATFGRGWQRRVDETRALALRMASGDPTAAPSSPATTLPPTPTKPATEAPKGSVGLFATLMSLIRSIFRR